MHKRKITIFLSILGFILVAGILGILLTSKQVDCNNSNHFCRVVQILRGKQVPKEVASTTEGKKITIKSILAGTSENTTTAEPTIGKRFDFKDGFVEIINFDDSILTLRIYHLAHRFIDNRAQSEIYSCDRDDIITIHTGDIFRVHSCTTEADIYWTFEYY